MNHANNINDADALMNACHRARRSSHTPQAERIGEPLSRLGSLSPRRLPAGARVSSTALWHSMKSSAIAAAWQRVTGNIGIVHLSTGDYPAGARVTTTARWHSLKSSAIAAAWQTSRATSASCTTAPATTPRRSSHYHRALALHEELGDRSGVARVTGNIGIVHATPATTPRRSVTTTAHWHSMKSSAIAAAWHASRATSAPCTAAPATTPRRSSHYHRALALHEELGDRSGVAGVTGNILAAYVEMGSDTEAQQLLATMDAMHIDDPGMRIHREQQRATLQERSGDLDGAAVTLQRGTERSTRARTALTGSRHAQGIARPCSQNATTLPDTSNTTTSTRASPKRSTARRQQLKLAMQAKQREIDAKDRETEKHMAVLHSTLPKHIADRVARGETVNDHYDNATVIFLDIVDFTTISDRIPSGHVVHLLEQIFTTLDAVCEKHDVVKIKTIGDSYMAVAFPLESSSTVSNEQRVQRLTCSMHVSRIPNDLPSGLLADLPEGIDPASSPNRTSQRSSNRWRIGTERMQYDVWGDTVNVASRMESTSEPGRIHVSEAFARSLLTLEMTTAPL